MTLNFFNRFMCDCCHVQLLKFHVMHKLSVVWLLSRVTPSHIKWHNWLIHTCQCTWSWSN